MHACMGEGNGNPLQYSCLENPRDRGAWWAAVYEVAQSRTRLKQLNSSSSSSKQRQSEGMEKDISSKYNQIVVLNCVERAILIRQKRL